MLFSFLRIALGNLSAMEKKHGEQTEKLQQEIKVLQKEAEGLFREIHFTLWLPSPGSLAQKRAILVQKARIECHQNSLLSSFAFFWSTDWQNYGRIFGWLIFFLILYIQNQYAYSPYWSLYISHGADKENLLKINSFFCWWSFPLFS